MTELLATISAIITAVLGWCGSVITFVMGQPLILISIIAFFFVGGAIGLVVRLIKS